MKTNRYWFLGIPPKSMAKSPTGLSSSGIHQFSDPSKLRTRTQLLSSSLLNVNGRQDHQPLFWFLSEFPFFRGRPGSVGALLALRWNYLSSSHSSSPKQASNLEPAVFPLLGHFPTHAPLFLQNLPSSTRNPTQELLSRQHSPFSTCQMGIYHNPFENWHTSYQTSVEN